jgi:hypothetical protein
VYLYIKKKKGEDPHTTHTSIQPVTDAPIEEKLPCDFCMDIFRYLRSF